MGRRQIDIEIALQAFHSQQWQNSGEARTRREPETVETGTIRDPSGRPRTKILREITREIIEMVDTKKKKQRARILIDAAFRQAEKGSLGHFNAIQRMLEEDTTSTRVELTAEGGAPKPKLSLQETIATIRQIYGLSRPEDEPLLESACLKSPNAREMLTLPQGASVALVR